MTSFSNIKKKVKLFSQKLLASVLALSMFTSSISLKNDPNKRLKVVVIDAGHGGKDPGCNGDKCLEKNVTLAVALRLGKLIESTMPDVKVIYTRKTDVFVELEERAQIANRNNADLFISIHCNAASTIVTTTDKNGKKRKKEVHNPKPYGSETYVMGIKNEAGNANVAKRENSSMLLEDNYKQRYNGFDPNSDESYIVMSNYTSAYVIQSASIALKIQDEYVKKAGRVDKGVRRESFWVLWRTTMPSILTELGFLTNPLEEKFLGTEKGQQYMASAIFKALRRYKDELEGKKKTYNDEIENLEALENENLIAQRDSSMIAANDTDSAKKDSITPDSAGQPAPDPGQTAITPPKKDTLKPVLTATASSSKTLSPTPVPSKKDTLKPALTATASSSKTFSTTAVPARNNPAELPDGAPTASLSTIGAGTHNDPPAPKRDTAKTTSVSTPSVAPVTPIATANVEFRVQFLSNDKELPSGSPKLKGVDQVKFYKMGAVYKYTSGSYASPEAASAQQAKLKTMGFADCFVVAFKNGQRIDMTEAKKLIGR